MPNQANGLYEFGSFRLDAAKRLLSRGSESVPLAPKTHDLLHLLVRSQGRVLNKRELMNELWPDTFVEEASLTYQVGALRRALGDEGEALIETVPRHGYRFTAAVAEIASDGARSYGLHRPDPGPSPRPELRHTPVVPWLVAVVASAVAMIVGIIHFHEQSVFPPAATIRFSIPLPEKLSLVPSMGSPVISPDGRMLAFVAFGPDGRQLLWIRRLDSGDAQALPGTESATLPFWAPDSRNLGFFASGKLKRVDITGGPPLALADVSSVPGGTWSRNGVVMFTKAGALFKVPSSGGPVAAALPEGVTGSGLIRWPCFLPDGRHFLYHLQAQQGDTGVYLGSLDSKETRLLMPSDYGAVYAPAAGSPGYLLFARGRALMARPLDPVRGRLFGGVLAVGDEVAADSVTSIEASVSENGILAYRSREVGWASQLTWLDRTGRKIATVGATEDHRRLALSPDETRVVFGVQDPQSQLESLWLTDVTRGIPTRFTFTPEMATFPVWSPDGKRIAFALNRQGGQSLYVKSSSGNDPEQLLLKHAVPNCWSTDGRYLVYTQVGPQTGWDIGVLPLDSHGAGSGKPSFWLQTPFNERNARLSPDGRWLAYASDESGRVEVYVRSFAPPEAAPGSSRPVEKWQVSAAGGNLPQWRGDGKELYYASADGKLMAMDVQADAQSFKPGVPHALFDVRVYTNIASVQFYAPSKDGRRFLIPVPIEEPPPPIHVIVGWEAAAKR